MSEIDKVNLVEVDWKPTTENVRKLLVAFERFNNDDEDTDEGIYLEYREAEYPIDFGDGWLYSVQSQYGGRGQGDDYNIIFSLSKNGEETTYWKIPGYYSSEEGGELEFSNTYQVIPVKVEITEWRKFKNKE